MDKYKFVGLINFIFGLIEGVLPLMAIFVILVSLMVAFIDSPKATLAAIDLRFVIVTVIFTGVGILNIRSAFYLCGNKQNQLNLEKEYNFGITLIFVSLLSLFLGGIFLLFLAINSVRSW